MFEILKKYNDKIRKDVENSLFFLDLRKNSIFMIDRKDMSFNTVSKDLIRQWLLNQGVSKEDIKALFEEGSGFIKNKTIIFNPQEKEEYRDLFFEYYNLFQKTELMKKCESSSAENNDFSFLKKYPHINCLLNNLLPKNEEKEHFLNWLSAVANKLEKLRVCWLFKGSQGTGKGFFVKQVLEPFFSENYVSEFDNGLLNSNFSLPKAQKALICVFNETKGYSVRDNNTIAERLKVLIADENMKFELKGVNSQIIKTYFNCIMFSNEELPIKIELTDRRYNIIQTNHQKLVEVVNSLFHSNMVDFEKKVKEEAEGFWIDLYNYKFDLSKASTVLENSFKNILTSRTETTKNLINAGISFENENMWELLRNCFLECDRDVFYEKLKISGYFFNEIYPLTDEKKLNFFYDFKKEVLEDCIEGFVKNCNLKIIIAFLEDEKYLKDQAFAKYFLNLGSSFLKNVSGKVYRVKPLTFKGKEFNNVF